MNVPTGLPVAPALRHVWFVRPSADRAIGRIVIGGTAGIHTISPSHWISEPRKPGMRMIGRSWLWMSKFERRPGHAGRRNCPCMSRNGVSRGSSARTSPSGSSSRWVMSPQCWRCWRSLAQPLRAIELPSGVKRTWGRWRPVSNDSSSRPAQSITWTRGPPTSVV